MRGRSGDFSLYVGCVVVDATFVGLWGSPSSSNARSFSTSRGPLLAKHGSRYGIPGKSNVRRKLSTTTLIAASGLMPLLPWKVSWHKFEPYARYRTVSSRSSSCVRGEERPEVRSSGLSSRDAVRRCSLGRS